MALLRIAIDGPAGSGKSTVAQTIADKLKLVYLDTGAMYRAVGLYMLNNGIDPEDGETVSARCREAVLTVRVEDGKQITCLNGEDVSSRIRGEDCSRAASGVSKLEAVRSHLVAQQQAFARGNSLVMDGRDIGTVVLPDADVKIYLTARPEVRAMRRYRDLLAKDPDTKFETVLEDLIRRDDQDTHREVSPLRQAEDAIVVDSSEMTQEEVVDRILQIVRERT